MPYYVNFAKPVQGASSFVTMVQVCAIPFGPARPCNSSRPAFVEIELVRDVCALSRLHPVLLSPRPLDSCGSRQKIQ